ncbi:unnamed protein product [Paramecium primaurelia]|uniref:WD40-repeat-containing domain n=1 Tax=Paramecium primaurelia TaxID=5886 RepID=A0A8S1QTX7_PARPR|nr:unnamed protein product [Paramecium primaurelia]
MKYNCIQKQREQIKQIRITKINEQVLLPQSNKLQKQQKKKRIKSVLKDTFYYEELKLINKIKANHIECPIGSIFDKRPPQREITYHQIQEVYQEQRCFALALNKQGSIMAGESKNDDNSEIQEQTQKVIIQMLRILFLINIQIGLQLEVQFVRSQDRKRLLIQFIGYHHNLVTLIQFENFIFSGSSNGSIKVWTLNTDKNQLMFDYQLNKHSKNSGQVSMNEEKTQIVSFSDDKTIIVWKKKENERKFKFKQVFENLKNDNGFSDCFLNKDTIAWVLFIYLNKKQKSLQTKMSFKLTQRINTYRWIILIFFYLQQSQVQIFIIKHYKYVNNLSYQSQSFNVQNEPNDSKSCKNYGNITEDGNYLIVWNDQTLSFYVYELKYH